VVTHYVEVPQPPITGYCKRCARCWVYESTEDYAVVSPSGVTHIGADYGITACGIDATGERWWWRL
jgi:hypothetical protein